ncbi:hypothetical protein ACHAQA_009827 [Verticillium albo-atrum]
MPTFLTHEKAPVYSSDTDFLDLDPTNTLRLGAKSKHPVHSTNGHTHNIVLGKHSSPPHPDDSFDESSFSSVPASDVSDSSPAQVNGTRPTSMSSLPRGKTMNGGGYEDDTADFTNHDTQYKGSVSSHPLQNGGVVRMPDRTAPPPPVMNGNVHSSEAAPSQHTQNTEPTTPARNSTTTPVAMEARTTNSPHRFSSPPIYEAGVEPSSSLQVPPSAGLKQRHTLEVPKLQSGRNSKDGHDTAFASGRFSPTAATAGVRRASLSLGRRNTRSLQSDAPRDDIVPDEDALRWAEAYRQKRASKRKKREEEDDDRVLVGTKVDEHHANWVTAYNMLTGIRVSVSRTNAKLDRPPTDADFVAKQKSTFDIAGNEMVPSAKYDFKFKDYAPWVFRRLRSLFRLDPADYLMSLTGKYILSELGSPGKSGSFFYFSRDYKYIIKTIHHAEHKFLRKILKDYYQHVSDNPNTLLSQFYGLHRVKMPYGKKIHFVVMNNLFPPHRDIHSTFDLKGSTIGRDYREEDLEKNPRATMKDLNWLRRQRSLELGIQKKRLFLEQLERDVALMKKLKIMDYSLLVGIHDVSRGNEENLRGKTLQVFNPGGDATQDDSEPQSVLLRTPSKLENARKAKELRQMIRQERPVPMGTSNKMPDELDEAHNRAGFIFNQDDGGLRATHEDNSPADEIYYLGVIDCLTHYGMIKKIEHFWKGLTSDRNQISATPPDQYGERFFHFVEGVTMSPEQSQREKQQKQQEEAAAVAADQENQRVSSWRSSNSRRRSNSTSAPPMPTHQPPLAPLPSGQKSPEAQEVIEKAELVAQRSAERGASEEHVPDKVITTIPAPDRRESGQAQSILPVVEEAAESHSLGGRSRDGDDEYRPVTPAKPSFLDKIPGFRDYAPPTPPKTGLKPESQDSGYGAMTRTKSNDAMSLSRDNSLSLQPRLSKDSLNKDLPPLPGESGPETRARLGFA